MSVIGRAGLLALALLGARALGPGVADVSGQSAQSAAERLRAVPPAPDRVQEASPAPAGLRIRGLPMGKRAVPGVPREAAAGPTAGAGRVGMYSLLLPGAGQLVRSQRRWLGYAALEGVAWYLHLDRRGAGHDLRDAYRELAWEVARGRTGPPVVDDFEYYERMGAWTSSGRYDVDPGAAGLQPETDPTTWNGAVWERAAAIFFGGDPGVGPGDPAWEAALTYYAERAYPAELSWDWSGTGEEPERFRSLVDESDDELREATVILGVIVANHLISAADAFVSARVAERTGGRVGGGLALVPRSGGTGRLGGALLLRVVVRP